MSLQTEFLPLSVEGITSLATQKKTDGWRYAQTLAVNTEEGIDLMYSFMKGDLLENHEIKGIQKGTKIPSITDQFLEAFVFENEIHDLFGVTIENIAIDFGGNFYALAQKEPMTIISPAQKAAREKAAKVAAAKAAKAKAEEAGESTPAKAPAADDLEAKLAGMDPEKAAKVRAAMEAKAKKEAAAAKAQQADDLEAKLANMDPEKAAKVRAAMEAKAKKEAAANAATADTSQAAAAADVENEKEGE